jgi:hypothetical protein
MSKDNIQDATTSTDDLTTNSPSTLPHLTTKSQTAIQKTKECVEKDILATYRLIPSSEKTALEAISRTIAEVSKFHSSKVRVENCFGIVGQSAAGKSSLVCALTDDEQAAIVEARGEAVTFCPTLYRERDPQLHPKKYTIDTSLPTANCIRKVCEGHWRSLNNRIDDSSNNKDDDAQASESEAGREALRSLCRQTGTIDVDDLCYGPDIRSYADAERNFETMMSCVSLPENLDENGDYRQTADTPERLQEILSEWREGALWSVIITMTIYMEADVLAGGLTLVDIPGLHDKNFFRESIARQAQRRCDELIVVCSMDRVIDNEILSSTVEGAAAESSTSTMHGRSITVAITHSADNLKGYEKYVDQSQWAEAKSTLKELKKADAPASQFRQAEKILDFIRIRHRNLAVIQKLQTEYASRLQNDQFYAFAIDSVLYWEQDTDEDDLSGIRALRAHLAWLSGKKLFTVFDDYVGWRFNLLLADFETWVAMCRMRPGALSCILPSAIAEIKVASIIEKCSLEFVACFDDQIVKRLNDSVSVIRTMIDTQCLEDWDKSMLPATARAICNHEGCFKPTKRKGSKTKKEKQGDRIVWDINRELVDCFVPVLEKNWHHFEDIVESMYQTWLTRVLKKVDVFISACEANGLPHDHIESLTRKKTELERQFTRAMNEFRDSWSTVKSRAVGSRELCYIKQVMMGTYDGAVAIRGTCNTAYLPVIAVLTTLRQWVQCEGSRSVVQEGSFQGSSQSLC